MVTESFDVHLSHPIDNTTDNEAAESFVEEGLSLEANSEVTSIVPIDFDEAGHAASHVPFVAINEEIIDESTNKSVDRPNNNFIDPLIDDEYTAYSSKNAKEYEGDAINDDDSLNDDMEVSTQVVYAEPIERPPKKKRGAPTKGPHQCPSCGNVFRFLSRFKNHFQQYHGERNLICPKDGCKSTFAQAKNFKEHLKEVHKMKKNEIDRYN